ncbi:MAG TPA: alpha-2-macroglobulin, partial [Treponemataceae bacterium]|nr:alpha-2-macroglobulin [Treponemataceae bacterium]
MKNNKALITTLFLFFLTLISCSKKTPSDTVLKRKSGQTHGNIPSYLENYPKNIEEFFTLDYTPQKPEEEKPAFTLSLDGPIVSSDVKDASIIPGIRKLSDYSTEYIDSLDSKKTKRPELDANSIVFEKEKGNLEIASWGPQQVLPAAIRQPSFYVIFNHPVKAISALSEPLSSSDVISISPPIQGVYRWYGSRHIAFEATENIDPLRKYTITVNKNTTSLGGNALKKEHVFTIYSEPLKITSISPGYTWAKKHRVRINNNDVIPEATNEVLINFNYPVDENIFKPLIRINVGKEQKNFSVKKHDEKSLLLNIHGAIPLNSKVEIEVKQPIDDNNKATQRASYLTLRNFTFKRSNVRRSSGQYLNPVYLYFSHDVDIESVITNISTEPYMPITKDNVEVWGTTVLLHGLPVKFDSFYDIKINGALIDVYERQLSTRKVAQQIRVKVPEAASFAKYLDSGSKMLEAEFVPKLLIEYQNLYDGSK